MKNLKLKEIKNEDNSKSFFGRLYKGACVKIQNSQKTYQVIGINPENKICWLREWPFLPENQRTFALEMSQIKLQIYCSNEFFK